jgi:lipid-binding SYLF domain-containing protein
MRRELFLILAVMLVASLVYAKSKEEERLADCATVLEEIMNVPDDIPQGLIDKAECIGVIPSVKKVAIGFGGNFGAGTFLCRGGEKFTGSWSAPAMYRLEGGSFGLQLGGSATDFVLLVMNPKGAEAIIKSKAKLGGDASAAAGPKGRTAAAATDVTMQAEVLTYSRAKGAFAGVSLEGSTLRPDDGANKDLYGREVKAREILREGKVAAPEAGKPLVAFLNKRSPKNLSQ